MPEDQTKNISNEGAAPLSGVHTASFAHLLEKLGCTIAVTAPQAGKLVLLRPESRASAPVVNTHFRTFHKPTGFAWEPNRFALGTIHEVREFHNMPDPPTAGSPHDAVFLPRVCHTTGDVAIHEMVWVPTQSTSELWFVNTRFSCLATRDERYSFVPRWKPPFVTVLDATDRCHLNGVCLRDGEIRYVTAIGETDEPDGWRTTRRSGGIVMDVKSNEVIARGLSMPHSPRWHEGKLWVLNSGSGGMGIIDAGTGRYEEVCRLPGFTRGLDFAGPFAFVGLSKVRDTAAFSGIELTEMPEDERRCGVWVVDIRSGKSVGFLQFTAAVAEVFAVQVLRGLRWPDVFDDDLKRIGAAFKFPVR